MNFCDFVVTAAANNPTRRALHIPAVHGIAETVSYADLLARAAAFQQAFRHHGLVTGSQVLMLARPSVGLYAAVLALLGAGCVPVLIDPGMGIKRIQASLEQVDIKLVVGEPSLLRFTKLFKALRPLPKLVLSEVSAQQSKAEQFNLVDLNEDAQGIITFTSGSTGKPKGANRTHASLIAQHLAIQANWQEQDTDIDSPCFPVLVLHNLSCGIETVMPAGDMGRPGEVDGERILQQLNQENITRIACAPAYLKQLTDAARLTGQTVLSVRSLLVGGSTLTKTLIEQAQAVFPQAEIRCVYGSTEAEPIAEVTVDNMLEHWHSDEGFLAGQPVDEVELIIVQPNAKLQTEADVLAARQPAYFSGEILVAGQHVLQGYINNPEANQENKISREQGDVWHRTGDTGYLDEQGQLWLTGRAKDRVQDCRTSDVWTLEKHIDELAGVRRSALINSADGPLLVLEGHPLDFPALLALLKQFELTNVRLAHVASMPVDGRHNSKIDRPTLQQWYKKSWLRATTLIDYQNQQPTLSPVTDQRFIVSLTPIDWLTLSAVLTTSLSVACAWQGHLYAATAWLFVAMLGDGLDGWLARKSGFLRPFGRYLDGFMDMLIYLIAPSVVYIQNGLNPLWLLPVVGAGAVRLSVFNDIGNPVGRHGTAYLGLPVFWSVFILGAYLLVDLILPTTWLNLLWGLGLLGFSYAMVRNRLSPKIHGLANILALTLGGSALFFLLHGVS